MVLQLQRMHSLWSFLYGSRDVSSLAIKLWRLINWGSFWRSDLLHNLFTQNPYRFVCFLFCFVLFCFSSKMLFRPLKWLPCHVVSNEEYRTRQSLRCFTWIFSVSVNFRLKGRSHKSVPSRNRNLQQQNYSCFRKTQI